MLYVDLFEKHNLIPLYPKKEEITWKYTWLWRKYTDGMRRNIATYSVDQKPFIGRKLIDFPFLEMYAVPFSNKELQ